MENTYLLLLLHCHLPYVRHPEHPEFLEEDWLFEAITETYVPVLDVLERLERDGVPFKLTLSFGPTLCEMLHDGLLRQRCLDYIARRMDLLQKESLRTRGSPYAEVVRMYGERYRDVWDTYKQRHGCDLLEAFKTLQLRGHLELCASAATHALLPLLKNRQAVAAQVELGCRNFRKHFGCRPAGMWLPECAYQPGLDATLRQSGLGYFFLDSHGLLLAEPRPVHGVFAPVTTPGGLAAFGRDPESSRQVWSRSEGYPGDVDYREFYRDVGFDADYDYVKPYLHPDGNRGYLGLKYHRITGDVPLHQKDVYSPGWARKKVRLHVADFLSARVSQAARVAGHIRRAPLIVAPYDAELFGHWWFEGVDFIDLLFREAARCYPQIQWVTPTEYLSQNPQLQLARPAASSWGNNGYFDSWVNSRNDWIYPHLHQAEDLMLALARDFPEAEGLPRRALNQCARELLLAQSSDWPFLMSTGTAGTYAASRLRAHLARFHALHRQIHDDNLDGNWLREIEHRDNIFEEMDYRLYAGDAEAG